MSVHDELDPVDREVAEGLERERPVPAAGFRGALARYLAAADPGFGPRPERLTLMVAAWLLVGLLLMVLGLLQATGSL
jgi:hypothetical protein